MNKEDFLRTLRTALHGLTPADIDDILADYSAHFDESTATGRREDATAQALGDPLWLAREHTADLLPQDSAGLLGAAQRLLARAKPPQPGNDQITHRQIPWTPGAHMDIALPVAVSWRPAQTPRAVLHGPAWLIEHVRLDSQGVRGRFKWRWFHANHLRLELEGPAIETWSVSGSADLRLLCLSQPALTLNRDGSGDIRAAGHVDHVTANVTGSGDIDLRLLDHIGATVRVTGSGDVTLGPEEEADLSVEGSGDIALLKTPPKIRVRVSGHGDIRTPDGTRLKTP